MFRFSIYLWHLFANFGFIHRVTSPGSTAVAPGHSDHQTIGSGKVRLQQIHESLVVTFVCPLNRLLSEAHFRS